MKKIIWIVLFVQMAVYSQQKAVYLYFGTDNSEKCTVKNADGTTKEIDSFFKMESKNGITYFICGERFFKAQANPVIKEITVKQMESMSYANIDELVSTWKSSGQAKNELYPNIMVVQKVTHDKAEIFKVKWM